MASQTRLATRIEPHQPLRLVRQVGSTIAGTTGTTHWVGGIPAGKASLTQDGAAITTGRNTMNLVMTGSASNPAFGGHAPPISYALNANLNFATRGISGSIRITAYVVKSSPGT